MYMHIYTCMYVYIYILYTCMYVYIHTHIYTHIGVVPVFGVSRRRIGIQCTAINQMCVCVCVLVWNKTKRAKQDKARQTRQSAPNKTKRAIPWDLWRQPCAHVQPRTCASYGNQVCPRALSSWFRSPVGSAWRWLASRRGRRNAAAAWCPSSGLCAPACALCVGVCMHAVHIRIERSCVCVLALVNKICVFTRRTWV